VIKALTRAVRSEDFPRWAARLHAAVAIVLASAIVLTSTIAIIAAHTSVAAAATPIRRFVTIGTGGPTGVYFITGQAICRIVENMSGARAVATGRLIKCQAPPTGGSRFNLSRLAIGAFDFALAQSDWQYYAYHGTRPDDIKPFGNLRAVMSLHAEPLQIIVSESSAIAGFADLAGHRVGIGNQGSGQRGTMTVLMERYRMTLDDFSGVGERTSTEAAAALCTGKTDAFVAATGFPAAFVAVAADGCGARILNLATEVERALVADKPYYAAVTIPAGTYRSTIKDITTFGPVATLVTRAEVDEATVYETTRAIFERIDTLRAAHPVLRTLDSHQMTRYGLTAPLHPGAIRYYRERGWM
jgi:TRAP transporter TAXI family solute receptor